MNSKKQTPRYWSGSESTWQRLWKRLSGPESAQESLNASGTRHGKGLERRSRLRPPARPWRALMLPLLVLPLATGCAISRDELIRTEIVRVEVPVQAALPAELLEPCVPSHPGGTTIEELAGWAEDLVLTLEACNKNRDEIRKLQPQDRT